MFDKDGAPAQVVTYVEDTKTFSFFYDKDLAPLDQPVHVVTLRATSESIYGNLNTAKFAENDYDVKFLNPCVDTSFVTLTEKAQTNPAADDYSNS